MIKKVLIYLNRVRAVDRRGVEAVRKKLSDLGIASVTEECGGIDAVIALGGDGTMLNAAHTALELGVPILGINFGTLGYMSGIESGELDMLSALKDAPKIDMRMLLDVSVYRSGRLEAGYTALNEAVISRMPDGGIATLELFCDGTKVCGYRADGLIVATPTGSSAYALSAGGPIIDTKLDAFCVCPICPHAIGSRPMVFSPKSELCVVNMTQNGALTVTADGKKVCGLDSGDKVTVKRSARSLGFIQLKEDAFYEVLYRKMR